MDGQKISDLLSWQEEMFFLLAKNILKLILWANFEDQMSPPPHVIFVYFLFYTLTATCTECRFVMVNVFGFFLAPGLTFHHQNVLNTSKRFCALV